MATSCRLVAWELRGGRGDVFPIPRTPTESAQMVPKERTLWRQVPGKAEYVPKASRTTLARLSRESYRMFRARSFCTAGCTFNLKSPSHLVRQPAPSVRSSSIHHTELKSRTLRSQAYATVPRGRRVYFVRHCTARRTASKLKESYSRAHRQTVGSLSCPAFAGALGLGHSLRCSPWRTATIRC